MDLSLNITPEDETCTFITTNLLEQSENFDEWLDKNGVQFIISSEHPEDNNGGSNHTSLPLDPLLIFSGCDEASDEEEIVSAAEDVPLIPSNSPEKFYDVKHVPIPQFLSSTSKYHYLEEQATKGALFVEFDVRLNEVYVEITNESGSLVFPRTYIGLSDASQTMLNHIRKQPISSLEKITLAADLKALMPCLTPKVGPKLFICPQKDCPLVFTRFAAAKLHALAELEHKPFKCNYPDCTWAFYTSFKLRRHQETHSNNKDFVCGVQNCGKRFTNVYNLNIHIKMHNRPATLPCPVAGCAMKFQTSRIREKHFKSHTMSEAPFVCPEKNCKRAFFLIADLQSHSRKHSHKLSELHCDFPNCGKVFEQPCRLREHIRVHTGQRPYVCTYDNCKWRFTTASKLKRHQTTHTKDRKFHCTIGFCTKAFMRSEHLREHTLTHIGTKSFCCAECSASFLGKSALQLHLKRVHYSGNNPRKVQTSEKERENTASTEIILEQTIDSLGVPSDMILGTGLIPEEPLELLENENFSTVNLRDLE